MRINLILLFLFVHISIFSQIIGEGGTTRAVIIGVSEYENDIEWLNYAHSDAEAFSAYLQSPAGGGLDERDQIKLLTNEEATTYGMEDALNWLVEESDPGDRAIIYFAGHGDIETKSSANRAFLLTYNAPTENYIAGAYAVIFLQDKISTLSQAGVEVIMIADACHAGKLAGHEIEGTKAAATILATQFANEIRILSCQPGQESQESENWGGGRGVFSHHLIQGLIGLADDGDMEVTRFEIGRYLEDKVMAETEKEQLPLIIGGQHDTPIALVDEKSLQTLKEEEEEKPELLAVNTQPKQRRSISKNPGDSLIWKVCNDYLACIQQGKLFEEQGELAEQNFRKVLLVDSFQSIHHTVKRKAAAALQKDPIEALINYLKGSEQELKNRYEGKTNYLDFPQYLEKAIFFLALGESFEVYDENGILDLQNTAQLNGRKQSYLQNLISKKLYFEGLIQRLEGDQDLLYQKDFYQKAKEKLEKSLMLEPDAAYVYNELGIIQTRLKNDQRAMEYYQKAMELAPTWGLPHVNHSVSLLYLGQYERALEAGEKALERMPDNPLVYNFLAWLHADYDWSVKASYDRKGVELTGNTLIQLQDRDRLEGNRANLDRAIQLLQTALIIDPNFFNTHLNLGTYYWQKKNYKEAREHLEKALQLDSSNRHVSYYLGKTFLDLGEVDQAEKRLLDAIEGFDTEFKRSLSGRDRYYEPWSVDNSWSLNSPFFIAEIFYKLGEGYENKGNIERAIHYYQLAQKVAPELKSKYRYYQHRASINLAKLYSGQRQFQKAETILLKLINSNVLPAFYEMGLLYLEMGRPEDAELMARIPKLFWNKDLEENEALLEQLTKPHKKKNKALFYPENCLQLAQEYDWFFQFERATILRKKAIKNMGKTRPPLATAFLYANALLKEGQLKKAALSIPVLPNRIFPKDSIVQKRLKNGERIFPLPNQFITGNTTSIEGSEFLLNKMKLLYHTQQPNLHLYGEFTLMETPSSFRCLSYESQLEFFLFQGDSSSFSSYLDDSYKGIALCPEESFNFIKSEFFVLYGQLDSALEVLDSAMISKTDDLQNLQSFYALFAYYKQPATSKEYFSQAKMEDVYKALELMRTNQFAEAEKEYSKISYTYKGRLGSYIKFKYLLMKVRQGNYEVAFQLLEELLVWELLSYHLFKTDPELEPLRAQKKFEHLMKKYFPSRGDSY